MAETGTIPAIVRAMSDDAALDAMITEKSAAQRHYPD
jgi:hypothetical protein